MIDPLHVFLYVGGFWERYMVHEEKTNFFQKKFSTMNFLPHVEEKKLRDTEYSPSPQKVLS